MLRPGYKPPTRQKLANELLDKVYDDEIMKSKEIFNAEIVTLAIDGWSNINNDPVISGSITKHDGTVSLVKTIDTSGEKHDAAYLKRLACEIKIETDGVFGCRIGILVTDSARNMSKMRSEIAEDDAFDHRMFNSYWKLIGTRCFKNYNWNQFNSATNITSD